MKGHQKSSRPRPSRAAPSSFAAPANFATKFNAFAAIERRGTGAFQVRCLLQWLTRPRTFVFMTLLLLVVPPLWFASRTAAPSPPPFAVEKTQLRASPRNQAEPPAVSTEERAPSPPAGAGRVKELAPAKRSKAEPLTPERASGREEDRIHGERSGGRREEGKKPSWKPPVLPVEVFRDVPPEECVRSPLWEKKVDPTDYEFGCKEINVREA